MKENFTKKVGSVSLIRYTVFIAIVTMIIGCIIGTWAHYTVSQDLLERTQEANLAASKSYGAMIQWLPNDMPIEEKIKNLEAQQATYPKPYETREIDIIPEGAVIIEDHTNDDKIPEIPIGIENGGDHVIEKIIKNKSDWVGATLGPDKMTRISAYTYHEEMKGFIGVHTSRQALEGKTWEILQPWWISVGLICFILLPGAVFLVHQSNTMFGKAALKEYAIAEQHLKDYDMALNGPNIGVWHLYPEEGKVQINPSLATWLGLPSDKHHIEPKKWKALFRKNTDTLEKAISKHVIKNSSNFSCELPVSVKGKPGWAFCCGKVVETTAKGTPVKVSGILLDITNQVEYKKELKRTNEELEAFLYKSSHNLKGPVASIKGLLILVKKSIMGQQPSAEYMGLMEKSALKLERTLEELMDLAKIKQASVNIQKVALSKLINDQIDAIKFLKGFNEMEISIKLDESTPFYSDPNLLESIFHNLIENAFKYRSDRVKPYLKITGQVSQEMAEIKVIDNGKGIPDNMQQMVFEMFYRAAPDVKGNGLGLYIVNNAIKRLNGKIYLESKERKGSEFTVVLPNRIATVEEKPTKAILHKT